MSSIAARFRRTTLVGIVVVSMLGIGAPAAQASIYTGACALSVTFNFKSPVRASGTAPDYTILVRDIAPCAVSLDAFNPLRNTNVTAYGGSSIWTCGAVLASGPWDENWTNTSGQIDSPPAIYGSHVITGTWGAWTMVLQNPQLSFTGVMQLTLSTSSALSLAQCLTGSVSSITMTGVMVFQDPS